MNIIILRIAWRNIWRNARRTIITLATMVICVGTMVWLITVGDGSHEQMIRSSLTTGIGSLQIHEAGYQEDKGIDVAILDPEPLLEIAREIPGVEGVSVRLNSFGLLVHPQGESQGSMLIGVDPANEKTISNIYEKIKVGEWLPETIEDESESEDDPDNESVRRRTRRLVPIVIGAGMAKKLNVDIGDRLFMMTQEFTRDTGGANCTIVGIFNTGMGEIDKSVAFIPIHDLRIAMGADIVFEDTGNGTSGDSTDERVPKYINSVHEITVLLEPRVDVHEAVSFVKGRIASEGLGEHEVLSWEEIQPGLRQFIDLDSQSLYIIMIFVFIIVAAGIMNTFLMAVFERIREFGILMSLGTRPFSIFQLVMVESIIVGILGAVFGLGAGLLGSWYNWHHPWSFESYSQMSDVMVFDWSMKIRPWIVWANILKAVGGIIIVTILAALWPAIKAALLRPVEALRHV